MVGSLPVLNLAEARYECLFGRGCEGICCKNGRPPIYADEIERIDANLDQVLLELRPEARAVVREQGYVSRRRCLGQPTARVVDGWCIFFNQGCVLHKLGAREGDKYRYKPAACALFPLEVDEHDQWYVRQKGFKKEKWDLFCLDPEASPLPAAQSLQDELTLALRFEAEANARRQQGAP